MLQVAGGHGQIDHELAMADMLRYHDAGFTTWDLADIYGPAEDFIGEFRRRLSKAKGKEELDKMQSFTKWVPQPSRITRSRSEEHTSKLQSLMRISYAVFCLKKKKKTKKKSNKNTKKTK